MTLEPVSLPPLAESAPSPVPAELVGARTAYRTLAGDSRARVYLDSAATTLMLARVNAAVQRLLEHYASTHSDAYVSAELAAEALAYARREVLALVGAADGGWHAMFAGSGSTAVLNRLAHALARLTPDRDVVVVSSLEHHSNDLPHRDHAKVVHAALETPDGNGLTTDGLERALAEYGQRIAYVAVTAASNVTGLIVPLARIARLARSVGAYVVVDGSQYVPHAPLDLGALARDGATIDALAFSGHKTYAPGAPGVLVLNHTLAATLPSTEFGGGMVASVHEHTFTPHHEPEERFEAGTPDIVGAFALGVAANTLRRLDPARIHARESALVERLWHALSAIPGVRLYGPAPDAAPRTGCVSFNVAGIDHGLTARILADHFNIQVRNGCFCAEPYVRRLLKDEVFELDLDPDAPDADARIARRLGLVRASLGLHNDASDVATLASALADVASDPARYTRAYREVGATGYAHEHGRPARVALDAIVGE